MSLTIDTITSYMGRFGEKDISSQIESKAPILKALPSTDADGERVDIFNIHGGFGNVGYQADGGSLISGGEISPVQGIQVPSIFLGRLSIPRATAKLTKGAKAGVDLMNATIESLTTRMSRLIGRAVIDATLGELDSAGATALNGIADGGTGDITVTDVAGFRAGDIVGLHDASASNAVGEYLLVNSVTFNPASATGTLNVTRDVHGTLGVSDPGLFTDANNAAAAGDFFKVYTPTTATEMTSIAKLASSDDVYGIDVSANAPYFHGTRINEGGALDDATLRQMSTSLLVNDGEMAAFVLMGPRAVQTYVDGLTGLRQFRPGDTWDVSGKNAWKPDFDGLPIEMDPNCPNTKAFFLPKRADKLQLRWFQRPRPESHGSVGVKGEKNYVFVSSTSYVYDQQVDAIASLRCQKRTAIGEVYGIT